MIPLLLVTASVALAQPATLTDHQPLPGYLELAQVEPVLEGGLRSVAACFEGRGGPAVAITVQLDISGEGAVSGLRAALEPETATDSACIQDALCSLRFPENDELSTRWSFSLAQRGGQTFLLPSLARQLPPRLPLFLFLPAAVTPEQHAWLQRVLGAGVYPVPALDPLPACPAHLPAPPPTSPATEGQP